MPDLGGLTSIFEQPPKIGRILRVYLIGLFSPSNRPPAPQGRAAAGRSSAPRRRRIRRGLAARPICGKPASSPRPHRRYHLASSYPRNSISPASWEPACRAHLRAARQGHRTRIGGHPLRARRATKSPRRIISRPTISYINASRWRRRRADYTCQPPSLRSALRGTRAKQIGSFSPVPPLFYDKFRFRRSSLRAQRMLRMHFHPTHPCGPVARRLRLHICLSRRLVAPHMFEAAHHGCS